MSHPGVEDNLMEDVFAIICVYHSQACADLSQMAALRYQPKQKVGDLLIPSAGMVGALISAGATGHSAAEVARSLRRREPQTSALKARYERYVTGTSDVTRQLPSDAIAHLLSIVPELEPLLGQFTKDGYSPERAVDWDSVVLKVHKYAALAKSAAPTRDDKGSKAVNITEVGISFTPVDSYPLFAWSPAQSVRHDLIKVRREDEDWSERVACFFDLEEWSRATRGVNTGSIFHLTGVDITEDLGEDKELTLTFGAARYEEALATQSLLNTDETTRALATRIIIDRGAHEYLAIAPPNNVYVNVSVVDRSGRAIALRRSSATHDTNNTWTLGICETLRRDDMGDGPDLDGIGSQPMAPAELARLGLRKELGLEPEEYGPIGISWIGINLWFPRPGSTIHERGGPGANIRIHAQVRSRLSAWEIDGRRSQSSDYFEHDKFATIDLVEPAIAEIVRSVELGQADSERRQWAQFSALAGQELLRMRQSPALASI